MTGCRNQIESKRVESRAERGTKIENVTVIIGITRFLEKNLNTPMDRPTARRTGNEVTLLGLLFFFEIKVMSVYYNSYSFDGVDAMQVNLFFGVGDRSNGLLSNPHGYATRTRSRGQPLSVTSTCYEDKNEPGRFLGEGVSFRAKLIGVLEVPEARGDRMCQEALADLKMAIRAAGEHKQRIQVHVAIDGLRLRDDKTGDSLYHHPVHKISFIAQDMTDSRAFGYIFGSPDTGHRFFGIKTDKAASQVVIAMRDLFQVVFELKKKEIELAKQQLEGKALASSISRHTSTASEPIKTKSASTAVESSMRSGADGSEGGVAELVDLEQELSSLRRGLTQVEGLTPAGDPFGDSFIVPPQKGLLPPPPSGSSSRGRNTPATAPTLSVSPRQAFSPSKTATALPFDLPAVAADIAETKSSSLVDNNFEPPTTNYPTSSTATSLSYDVFTELDPLGTGRSKPYVDKKLFFQELKNPPKKVLKDLVPTTTAAGSSALLADIMATVTATAETVKAGRTYTATTITSVPRQSGGSVSIVRPPASMFSGGVFAMDPFAETDPFDSADPFSETCKEDPFLSSLQEFPKLKSEDGHVQLTRELSQSSERSGSDSGKNVFNGPLQVTLPPEPAPKSPRLQRQATDTSTIRQRPQPSTKVNNESVSPPPPLPPKKAPEAGGTTRPPPRPPHDYEEEAPPLPRPVRRKEPTADRSTKPRLSSAATNSSEDEYLTPVPPPLPGGRRFDITLSQLLTCGMDELAAKLRVPAAGLANMTLPQLTAYLRSYLADEKQNNKPEPTIQPELEIVDDEPPPAPTSDLKPQFEDDFTPTPATNGTFVANFDDFDKKVNATYDRYAAFREIQEEELKSKSILDPTPDEQKQNSETENREDSDKEELTALEQNKDQKKEQNDTTTSRSPLKTLDELTLDSFNMFRNSVSPKPTQVDAKIEDIKNVMKNLQIEQSRRSVSPRDNGTEKKQDEKNDRYAALREITITEPPLDEFESLPPEVNKERKRSDEKSDGFDNSDFFDCIDNSSLSFSHVDDAFRKSPSVIKEKLESEIHIIEEKKIELKSPSNPVREPPPPARLSTGSLSDVPSGSSPDTKDKSGGRSAEGGGAGRWSVLAARASPWSSDSKDSDAWRDRTPPLPRPRRRPRHCREPADANIRRAVCYRVRFCVYQVRRMYARERAVNDQTHSFRGLVAPRKFTRFSPANKSVVMSFSRFSPRTILLNYSPARAASFADIRQGQTSSSSRDVSPWEEEPPAPRHHRHPHAHAHTRDSRHNSSGSRECLDSGSGRDKEKLRDKRDRDRDSRDSGSTRERDRRDSGSGRDRTRDISKERDHKERDYRDRRDRRSRERDKSTWERDYSREREYRDSRSRERSKDYKEKERDRHRMPHHSWDDEEDYSEGSSPRDRERDRWPDHRWRRDECSYGSLGWRETRRRAELHPPDDALHGRYGTTLSWSGRRTLSSGAGGGPGVGTLPARARDERRRGRRDERHRRDRFERETDSPFDEFLDGPPQHAHAPSLPQPKKRGLYSSLEGTRFAFESEETTASPLTPPARRDADAPPAARFRYDSESLSPRSMFEDDFQPRARAPSIAEEEEDVAPLRTGQPARQHRDIRKSDSVNIFTRETDPFEGDDFFACTGSDRAARRDNWPGDFQPFDNV
ncbi:Protein disabled [Eumeta japonica]|uniref:Protein disabled n=1 Tax=Eumeta variegata TaxID=151549 RepID=A0A4C1U9D7_EUMVA|nr:Protein disabled [Eumeta japonica]